MQLVIAKEGVERKEKPCSTAAVECVWVAFLLKARVPCAGA
jgi:hypothetical protein